MHSGQPEEKYHVVNSLDSIIGPSLRGEGCLIGSSSFSLVLCPNEEYYAPCEVAIYPRITYIQLVIQLVIEQLLSKAGVLSCCRITYFILCAMTVLLYRIISHFLLLPYYFPYFTLDPHYSPDHVKTKVYLIKAVSIHVGKYEIT